MAETITVHAREKNSYTIGVTTTDEAAAGCTAITMTWTLTDMDGNVINGHDATAASPTATTENIVLTPTATAIVVGQNNKRLFLVEWTYNSTYGSAMVGKANAIFVIDNLLHIT